MQLSRADIVTEWVVYAIRAFGELPFDLQVEPFTSDETAQSERLIVKVDEGRQYLEADQGFDDTLTLTFKTTARDAAEVGDIWAKVDAAFIEGLLNDTSSTSARMKFSQLIMITEDATSSKEVSAGLRKFTHTIPLKVKLL